MTGIFIAVLAMGFVTLLTRAFPFMIFAKKHPPELFLKGARLIPGAVMTVLVMTSLPLTDISARPGFLIPWISGAVVAVLHLIKKNALLSIFGGTAVYMTLLNFF